MQLVLSKVINKPKAFNNKFVAYTSSDLNGNNLCDTLPNTPMPKLHIVFIKYLSIAVGFAESSSQPQTE